MLQKGDVLFVRGYETNLVDDGIKLGEWIMQRRQRKHIPFKGLYVHCCVYDGRSAVYEAQGFRKSGKAPISTYDGDYDVERIPMNAYQLDAFIVALKSEDGLPYDWPGIFWLIVKIITGYDSHYKERKRRYCSKYIAWAARKVGIMLDGTTPETLALSIQTYRASVA